MTVANGELQTGAAVQIQSPAQPADMPGTAAPDLDGARSRRPPEDRPNQDLIRAEPATNPAAPPLNAYGATGRLVPDAAPGGISILA